MELDFSHVTVIGFGACNFRGDHPMFEVSGNGVSSIVEPVWFYPWGIYSRCAICEVKGKKYDVILLGDPDEYGHYRIFEVNGRRITVNWVNAYNNYKKVIPPCDNSTNVGIEDVTSADFEDDELDEDDEVVMETRYQNYFPLKEFKYLVFFLAVVFVYLLLFQDEIIEKNQEKDISASHYDLHRELNINVLKFLSYYKLPLNQMINNQEIYNYIYDKEDNDSVFIRILRQKKEAQAENMKKLVLGSKYRKYNRYC